MKNNRILLISVIVIGAFFTGVMLNMLNITPAPHMDDMGSGSLLDTLFAIALAGVVVYLASGLGWLLLKPFKLADWSFSEKTVLAVPLGLAVIAYGEFFMGLLGWLKPFHHIAWLMVIAIIAIKYSSEFLREWTNALKSFKLTWNIFSPVKKILLLAGILTIILALFLTFTPPWDYDGLMYHLEGPKLFLQAGRIIPIPENWFTYYPSTWEMLYMLGMGLGSDIFARLMHFSSLILLILATYSFGRRFLSKTGGWLSAAVMVGIPILFLWGICAYIDLTWALFQFLAVGLFVVWTQKKHVSLLILSGIMQGLSLGCKYPALTNAAILGVCVIFFSLRRGNFKSGWKQALVNAVLFSASALIIASPWYLKNFLWTGSPIFPLYLPQSTINPLQIDLWMRYVDNFGVGKQWYNYLLLPFSIYFNFEKFGTFLVSMDMPSPIFLLCWGYPLIRKRLPENIRRVLDILGIVTALQFIAWAFGSQQGRFLIPIFPSLSIIASSVLISLAKHPRLSRLGRIVAVGLTSGLVISSLIFMGLYNVIIRPHRLLLGTQSKAEFLEFVLRDWKGMQFINQELPPDAKVFMPWDGKGYYCVHKCLPDMDHSRWTALVQETTDHGEVVHWMEDNQITHLLLSKEDMSYFLTLHDIDGIVRSSYEYLVQQFAPNCTEKVYADEWIMILRIEPTKPGCK